MISQRPEGANLTERIFTFLESRKVEFLTIDHAESPTCEESAIARGRPLMVGGKTLLLKSKKGFHLFTISAAKEVDNKKVRKILASDRLRFAKDEELKNLIGVPKGAIPPLGRPVLPFDLYIDESVFKLDEVAFNAGCLTKSVVLSINNYLKLVDPIRCDFSK